MATSSTRTEVIFFCPETGEFYLCVCGAILPQEVFFFFLALEILSKDDLSERLLEWRVKGCRVKGRGET